MLTLGQEAASETDPDKRGELYQEYQGLFLEEVRNLIPICLLHQIVAADPKVSGLHAAVDYTDLRGVAVSP